MKVVELSNPPPVSELIERFGRRRLPFVLDSAQSNDGMGEWSFFGADPFAVVSEHGSGPGLEGLRETLRPLAVENSSGIPFVGGAVGFLSYDFGRRLEQLPSIALDDRELPDLHFGLYDGIAALHHASGVLYLVALGLRGPEATVLEELGQIVAGPAECGALRGQADLPERPRCGPWEWNLSQVQYCARVSRIRDYIASGDVYQVNVSRRARCRYEGDPVQLYRALREGNAAPYAAYLDLGDLQVLSTSPEQLLRKQGGVVETRPIKGTRPRGEDPVENARNAAQLADSAKDRAELLMIVDLERNDLGRVAEYGSVRVEGLYRQEHYARVIHQTAQVKAALAAGKDVFDCLRALFPGGSITGAPKVRAMEIIEALEPTRRGVYCGSIGYIGFDGNAEFNIAIRSLHLTGGYLDYQVGGGVVWDSEPESEYTETLDKGRAIREAIEALCQP